MPFQKLDYHAGYWTLVEGDQRIRMEVPDAKSSDDILVAQATHFATRNATDSTLAKRFQVYSYSVVTNGIEESVTTLSIGNVAAAIALAPFAAAVAYFFYTASKGNGKTSIDVGGGGGDAGARRQFHSRITGASAVRRDLTGGLTITTSCDSGDCASSEEYSQDDDNDIATQIYNMAVDNDSGDGSGQYPGDYSNVDFGITWMDDVGTVTETVNVQAYSD